MSKRAIHVGVVVTSNRTGYYRSVHPITYDKIIIISENLTYDHFYYIIINQYVNDYSDAVFLTFLKLNVSVNQSIFTVIILYEGTSVAYWTTAHGSFGRRCHIVQLAVVCFILATLTLAARCYASTTYYTGTTSTSNPTPTTTLVQTDRHHTNISSINTNNNNNNSNSNNNSNIHSHSTSKFIVLSRLLRIYHQPLRQPKRRHHQHHHFYIVQSVISAGGFYKSVGGDSSVTNSNSNRDSTGSSTTIRTKRELKTKTIVDENSTLEKSSTSLFDLNKNSVFDRRTLRTSASIVNLDQRTESDKNIITSENDDGNVEGVGERGDDDNNNNNDDDDNVKSSYVNVSRIDQENGSGCEGKTDAAEEDYSSTKRPMPPVNDHDNSSSATDLGILVLLLSTVVLTVALGLVTCVLSHYRAGAGVGAVGGGTTADRHDPVQTPTTAPMLSVVSAGAAAGVGGMDRLRGGRAARELAATRDRQVRLHAVHTDFAINMPPSLAMPDGEEHPFTSSRLHVRDPEQESEIHQKCIRPPPNRTVLESESPPPYRSSSTGLLGGGGGGGCSTGSSSVSSYGSSGEWSCSGGGGVGGGGGGSFVVRCHSMSSTCSAASTSAIAGVGGSTGGVGGIATPLTTATTTTATTTRRPEAGSSGQKTDFLQRTVKILTGKKSQTQQQPPPPAAPTLSVVIVPTRQRRTSNDQPQQPPQQQQQQQHSTTGRPKPSV